MTYVKPDPSTMTAAELADYQARTGIAPDVGPTGATVEVPFSGPEFNQVLERSEAADRPVAEFVHDAALRPD